MRSINLKKGLFAATAAATLCAGAIADVVIVLPSGDFGGGQDFSITSPPISGTLTGIIFSYEYSNAAGASWASDMGATVGASQWGYFNRFCNGASINEGATGAPGNGTAINFTSATLPIATPVTYNNETVLVGWGNSWTGGSGTMANVTLTLVGVGPGTAPTSPTGVGAATNLGGGSYLLRVTTYGGINPASTGITVAGDLTGLGGGASVPFLDNGLNGDETAGDGIFSYMSTYPATAIDGDVFTVAFTVNDAQSRSSTGSIGFTADLAGQTLATAFVPAGTGPLDSLSGTLTANDVDMYKINICDTASFTALTAPATADTQLFLFNLDGTGVTSNDDDPAGGTDSIITGAFVPAAGDYYIAVTRYNTDPVDASAALIWANTPFNTERAPDGPGAANPLDSWTGATGGTATYTITFTGTCYPSAGPVCGPADIGGTGGAPGADGHLDNNDFIVYIDNFFNNLASADIGTTGGVPGSDGIWDNNDFIVFIDQFFAAPASCR